VPEAHLIKLGSFGEYAQCGLEIPEGYFTPRATPARTADRPVPFPREADDIYHITKIHDTNYSALACRKWDLRVTDVMQMHRLRRVVPRPADAPASLPASTTTPCSAPSSIASPPRSSPASR
jgi:hypothetical protein